MELYFLNTINKAHKLLETFQGDTRKHRKKKTEWGYGKWSTILQAVFKLKIGETIRVDLREDQTNTQARNLLRISKVTRDFRWTVKTLDRNRVEITKKCIKHPQQKDLTTRTQLDNIRTEMSKNNETRHLEFDTEEEQVSTANKEFGGDEFTRKHHKVTRDHSSETGNKFTVNC